MKTTREKIEVMQAYEKGEQIQIYCSDTNEWEDVESTLLWDWVNFDYRIKSKNSDKLIKFKFKDGDILFATSLNSWILIYKENEDKKKIYKYVAVPVCTFDTSIYINDAPLFNKEDISEIRFATEEEKQKLFDILKENNYHWNAKTKTLEKLVGPKFKVGDVVQHDDYKVRITEVNTDDNLYGYELLLDLGIGSIPFSKQDCWELAPNKFDITTLKPFDKVLVRTNKFDPSWTIDFYDGYRPKIGGSFTPFAVTGGNYFQQCIPYKGNEHLLGTTNDCDDFYKTW